MSSEFRVVNPTTGDVIAEFPESNAAKVEESITSALQAFGPWSSTSATHRSSILRRAAELMDEQKQELAFLATQEMGKLLTEAVAEVELCAQIFDYYATNGPKFMEDEPLSYEGAFLQRRPLGPILGIMPWNYPYYQIARFAAPNLMLGNTLIVKPAPACPESAKKLEELLHAAGVPAGAYGTIFAGVERTAHLVTDPRIRGVSLTGSERAGAAVGALAGAQLKKHVLELGGSDPFIVLDTDDLDSVIALAAESRMENAGQACSSPKRFIVADPLYDKFVEGLKVQLESYLPGDPLDPSTRLAPMSSTSAARSLVSQINGAIASGARLHTGGKISGSAFVSPALLTDIRPGTRAYSEELFGPVAVVYRAKDEDDAVRLANDSPYGLGASIFTGDAELAERVAEQLEVGMVSVNQLPPSSAELPFGGIKNSGVGRELGPLGMDEFVNRKLVVKGKRPAGTPILP